MKNYFKSAFFIIFLVVISCDDNSNKKKQNLKNPLHLQWFHLLSPICLLIKLFMILAPSKKETVETIFTFTNTGKSDLIIVDVAEVVAVLSLNIQNTPIAPGDSGKIRVL